MVLLSVPARLEAAPAWKVKHGEIMRARHRRSIALEPLEEMPPPTALIDWAGRLQKT